MNFLRALLVLLPFAFTLSLDASAAAEKKAPASTEAPQGDAVDDEDDGFMSYVYMVNDWYPIVLDPHLEPEVEEKVIWLWITTIFCGALCGPLWIPMLIVGEDPGIEYFMQEALIAIVIEILTYVLGGATTSFFGLGSILITANLFYLAPVSLINGYDRALKRQRAKGPLIDDDAPAKKGEARRRARAPAVAMAY